MKKILNSLAVLCFCLFFLQSCDTNPLNPVDESTDDGKSAIGSKSTRSGWRKIGGDINNDGTLNNAKAIAAFGDVWVASSSNSLYLCYEGGDFFRPINVSFSSNVVEMAAGPETYVGIGSGGTGSVYHKGVYILTADGKVHGLYYSKGRFWTEDEDVAPATMIAVNENGTLFSVGSDNMIRRKLTNGSTMVLDYYAPFTIKEITAGNNSDLSVTVLGDNNKAYNVLYSSNAGEYLEHEVNTGGYTLVKDIEMGKNPSHGIWDYAFFRIWYGTTGRVVFKTHLGDYHDVGSCRMIAVDGNVLWDAYRGGIYKIEK